jgi:hypothetical protein
VNSEATVSIDMSMEYDPTTRECPARLPECSPLAMDKDVHIRKVNKDSFCTDGKTSTLLPTTTISQKGYTANLSKRIAGEPSNRSTWVRESVQDMIQRESEGSNSTSGDCNTA